MYLMYADESGDIGKLPGSPTRYYVLTGIVVHELRWQPYLNQLMAFRQNMKQRFGLRPREEIHAAKMISRPGSLQCIRRNDRLLILRSLADELASMTDLNIINIVVDKQGKSPAYDVFENAWKALIQRFENTISRGNFRGPRNPDERGIIFPDNTINQRLIKMMRKMHRYNPVPHHPVIGQGGYRNLTLTTILEDPNFRDSRASYFVQAADLCAFLLYQNKQPNNYIRRNAGHNYFHRLEPILCMVASRTDPYGVVNL